MDETLSSKKKPKTAEEYEAAVDECLAQMEQIRQQIRSDDTEIARLKAETRTLLHKMKAA